MAKIADLGSTAAGQITCDGTVDGVALATLESDLADEIWRLSDGPAGESRHLAGLQAWMDGGRSR